MSYISSWLHCVFSTKERRPLITPPRRERLWPFIGGIAQQNRMKASEIGGVPERVHILICRIELQASLRDAGPLGVIPGAEAPGYSRDVPPGQSLKATRREHPRQP